MLNDHRDAASAVPSMAHAANLFIHRGGATIRMLGLNSLELKIFQSIHSMR
jgi:hypothetical protein